MAGIGFELKRLFDRRTLTGQTMAYGYSAIITAGPFALLTSMVLLIQLLFVQYGVAKGAGQLYTASVIYPFVFSQLLTCGFAMVITRYLADKLYQGEYENVTASCYGIIFISQLLGAVAAVAFYWDKPLAFELKLATYVFFMEMSAVWLQGVYLTALKDYKSIFLSYGGGGAISVLLAWANLHFALGEPVLGSMVAMCIGTGVIVCCFMVQIARYFGYPAEGMNFEFLPYFEVHYRLFGVAFFYTLAIYAANFIIWQGPWGVTVADTYLYSPRYDVVTFYAFLSILPTMIMFVVSMELKFYERYAVYFTYITQKGNFQDIEDARKELLHTLWTEFKNIMEFQLVFSLMFLAAGGYLLSMGGVSYQDVNIYRILVLGAFFNAVLQVVYTLLLYLEDQHGALMIAAVFLGANLVLGMGGLWLGEASYGFTFFLSALLACAVAVMRLQHFCQRISYYVFCGRPVFFEAPHGVFSRLAAFLYRDRQERNA